MRVIIFILPFVTRGLSDMEPFVVQGKVAKIEDYPYVAYISVQKDDKVSWSCGSSILNQHIILTAAHCLHECSSKSSIIVSFGHDTIFMGVMSSGYSFLVHESFNRLSSANDIGLVRVKTPISFNVNVSRVALMRHPPYNEEAVIAGWGYIDEIKTLSSDVFTASIQRIWSKENCVYRLRSMPAGTFCASDMSGKSYPSLGDSGSPLVVQKYIQTGIVSHKKPDISRKIIVYTDTGYFYKWIKRNANRMMCP